jgi:hypothetical protein
MRRVLECEGRCRAVNHTWNGAQSAPRFFAVFVQLTRIIGVIDGIIMPLITPIRM